MTASTPAAERAAAPPAPAVAGEAPSATPADLRRTIADLCSAQRALASRPRAEIVRTIEGVVDDWLTPGSRWMDRASAALPTATGFSPAMIRYALPTMLEPLRSPALGELVAREADGRVAPRLVLHVLPGNLPGLAAIPAALSLAIGAAALLKPGRGDRVFPALFIASIAARDPELATCLAAAYWPGGHRDCEDVAIAAADLVIAAGDDATIADLAQRGRGRFIGHGHRISFAVVSRALAGERDSAAALALDTAVWDQRGCLSPQLCFVEGDVQDATAFATAVADELARLAVDLPPAEMTVGDRLAIRRFRDESEWARFDGEPARVVAAADEAAGTVVVEPRPALRPSPLGRSLRIMPIPTLASLREVLRPFRAVLEGAGVAVEPERRPAAAAVLRECGVHLVSPLGAMQRPPLDWRQGGRSRLGSWFGDDAA